MQNERDIALRLRIVYLTAVLFGIAIIVRAFMIGVVQREQWLAKKEKEVLRYHTVEASRGNIYADDGSLLATSLPIYTVRLDFQVERLRKIFPEKIDSLAEGLHKIFPETTASEFKQELRKGYRAKSRSALVAKDLNYKQLSEMRKLPILRGRAKYGMILESQERRVMPFRSLAYKTLGNIYDQGKLTGLEAYYNNYLKGSNGKRLKQKMSGGDWKEVNSENEIEPKEGSDIVSTIDVQLQDVAESALRKQLLINKAEQGCVVLMEVKTGQIKAISNLTRSKGDSTRYTEESNLSVAAKWDPGSTFKLASVLALIEDGLVDTNEIFDTQGGVIRYCNHPIYDSKEGGYGRITLADAFIQSSNVGIIKAVMKGYQGQQKKFIERLKAFHLGIPSGIDLKEELRPTIYYPGHEKWSCLSMPSLAMGYEVLLPPIQMLAFYNAVANDGVMMKPQLVSEIRHNGKTVKRFDPVVLDSSICSKAAIRKVKPLMKGVVERGTAKNLRNPYYQIAGKTGTVKKKFKVKGVEKKSYRASFAGFFPYDNPKYSCIVVIENPSQAGFYGNIVAGPVFKEVADKVYARSREMHQGYVKVLAANEIKPEINPGFTEDLRVIASNTGMKVSMPETRWTRIRQAGETLVAKPESFNNNLMPDVTGMGLRDAIFLLENMGISVKPTGKGKVKKQSIPAGTRVGRNSHVIIELV